MSLLAPFPAVPPDFSPSEKPEPVVYYRKSSTSHHDASAMLRLDDHDDDTNHDTQSRTRSPQAPRYMLGGRVIGLPQAGGAGGGDQPLRQSSFKNMQEGASRMFSALLTNVESSFKLSARSASFKSPRASLNETQADGTSFSLAHPGPPPLEALSRSPPSTSLVPPPPLLIDHQSSSFSTTQHHQQQPPSGPPSTAAAPVPPAQQSSTATTFKAVNSHTRSDEVNATLNNSTEHINQIALHAYEPSARKILLNYRQRKESRPMTKPDIANLAPPARPHLKLIEAPQSIQATAQPKKKVRSVRFDDSRGSANTNEFCDPEPPKITLAPSIASVIAATIAATTAASLAAAASKFSSAKDKTSTSLSTSTTSITTAASSAATTAGNPNNLTASNSGILSRASSLTDSRRYSSAFDIPLNLVLRFRQSRDQFHEHLKAEYSESNLLFWETAQMYKERSVLEKTPDWDEAVHVCKQFLTAGSADCVNISAKTLTVIMGELRSPATVTGDVFVQAQAEIYDLMSRDAYNRFKQTDTGLCVLQWLLAQNNATMPPNDSDNNNSNNNNSSSKKRRPSDSGKVQFLTPQSLQDQAIAQHAPHDLKSQKQDPSLRRDSNSANDVKHHQQPQHQSSDLQAPASSSRSTATATSTTTASKTRTSPMMLVSSLLHGKQQSPTPRDQDISLEVVTSMFRGNSDVGSPAPLNSPTNQRRASPQIPPMKQPIGGVMLAKHLTNDDDENSLVGTASTVATTVTEASKIERQSQAMMPGYHDRDTASESFSTVTSPTTNKKDSPPLNYYHSSFTTTATATSTTTTATASSSTTTATTTSSSHNHYNLKTTSLSVFSPSPHSSLNSNAETAFLLPTHSIATSTTTATTSSARSERVGFTLRTMFEISDKKSNLRNLRQRGHQRRYSESARQAAAQQMGGGAQQQQQQRNKKQPHFPIPREELMALIAAAPSTHVINNINNDNNNSNDGNAGSDQPDWGLQRATSERLCEVVGSPSGIFRHLSATRVRSMKRSWSVEL